jgi:CheY-like chemotaxis protein
MGYSILLVDDNKLFIDIEKEFLKCAEVDISTANNGLAALDFIHDKRPNLIFMDLQMPNMNGADCCRTIKSDPVLSGIPIVLVTSKDNAEDVELCYAAGCDEFLGKPLDRVAFIEAAHKFLPSINRRERRVAVSLTACLRVDDHQQSSTIYDLSVGGAYLSCDYVGTPDTVVHIFFELPDCTAVDCHGRIVWINRSSGQYPPGVGLKFAWMPQPMHEALKKFVAANIR